MKYSHIFFTLIMISGSFLFTACETTIQPELESADPILVVDAWINDKFEDQVILLTKTQPYLDNVLPPGVSGAIVKVDYEGGTLTFTEDDNQPGRYVWHPSTQSDVTNAFGKIGRDYQLNVQTGGETFIAKSRINRTVHIDSVTFKLEENSAFYPAGSYTGEFWAKENPGRGDTYWIRGYKNGMALDKPSEIITAYDAGFSAGGNFDGGTFIPPLRSINPNDVDANDQNLPPYKVGDSLYVEVHSITLAAFYFLNEVATQTDRPGGFGQLFATPLANVSTNIMNSNPAGSKALGFFNVAAVNGKGKKLVK